MATITKQGNSVVIVNGEVTNQFPLNTIFAHVNEISQSLDIKLRASRKTIMSLDYRDVTEPASTSAEDLLTKVTPLFYA